MEADGLASVRGGWTRPSTPSVADDSIALAGTRPTLRETALAYDSSQAYERTAGLLIAHGRPPLPPPREVRAAQDDGGARPPSAAPSAASMPSRAGSRRSGGGGGSARARAAFVLVPLDRLGLVDTDLPPEYIAALEQNETDELQSRMGGTPADSEPDGDLQVSRPIASGNVTPIHGAAGREQPPGPPPLPPPPPLLPPPPADASVRPAHPDGHDLPAGASLQLPPLPLLPPPPTDATARAAHPTGFYLPPGVLPPLPPGPPPARPIPLGIPSICQVPVARGEPSLLE